MASKRPAPSPKPERSSTAGSTNTSNKRASSKRKHTKKRVVTASASSSTDAESKKSKSTKKSRSAVRKPAASKPAPTAKPKATKPKKVRTIVPVVLPEEPSEAWHRRLDEGAKAYNAFCYYYSLSPQTRSIDAAYRVFWEEEQQQKAHEKFLQQQAMERAASKKTYSKTAAKVQQKTPPSPLPVDEAKPPKRASRLWFGWSAEYDWVQRALKHDQYQAEQRAKRNFDKAFKRLEKQQLDVEMAQQLGAKWLLDLLADKRFSTLEYEKQVGLALNYMRLLPSLQEAERSVMGVIQSILNQQAKVSFTNE